MVKAERRIDSGDRLDQGFSPTSMSRGKRSAAAAGSGRVGVGEFKAAAVESGDEIDNCALEEGDAFRINVNSQVFEI